MSVCKRVLSVGFGPGLDSIFHPQDTVDTIYTVSFDCGRPPTRRLYPFGALICYYVHH